eukprot:CAMPEP_0184350396 /NCGR_PEP_ID=MMETSP1089-20130417/37699_1 /TAXON_ID=38269 ORGANISM="Gloeochaete wittrockiana, Strain SAG46.84" /NCGR_SAMPLE_ID=MMETSP1089 /ASSEMBLY_ACC=CAM_ASM_000445 /LENGTH=241 /DNA_ID=CAMNT_0026683105 /DNA_START=34 /DNA_END=759 /DNA_ORIENTATION=-
MAKAKVPETPLSRWPWEPPYNEDEVKEEMSIYQAWSQKSAIGVFLSSLPRDHFFLAAVTSSNSGDTFKRAPRVISIFFSIFLVWFLCALIVKPNVGSFFICGVYSSALAFLFTFLITWMFHNLLLDKKKHEWKFEMPPREAPVPPVWYKRRTFWRVVFEVAMCVFLIGLTCFFAYWCTLFNIKQDDEGGSTFWFFSGIFGIFLNIFFWWNAKVYLEAWLWIRELKAVLAVGDKHETISLKV